MTSPPPGVSSGRPPSRRAVLRAGLAGAAGIPLTAALAGCGSGTSISSDPAELVLWYWNRSIAPSLLQKAAEQIPGTSKRLRADVIGAPSTASCARGSPRGPTSPTSPP